MVNRATPRTGRRAAAPPPVAAAPPPLRSRRAGVGPVPGTERTAYEDETGRIWTVLVPAGHPEEAERGMVLGPPDLSGLSLPEPLAVRLHNELQARGLLTAADLRGRGDPLAAALTAALRLDVQRLAQAFLAPADDAGGG